VKHGTLEKNLRKDVECRILTYTFLDSNVKLRGTVQIQIRHHNVQFTCKTIGITIIHTQLQVPGTCVQVRVVEKYFLQTSERVMSVDVVFEY
jgi:tRNA(Ser,Leu) C12 N-acetylase TAN1